MKKRTVSIITMLSLILALFVPFNVTASEKLYNEEDTQYMGLEQNMQNDTNASLNDSFITTNKEQLHTEEKKILSKKVLSYVATNDIVEYEYVVNTDIEYDYVSVVFMNTDGVILNTKSFQDKLSYGDPIIRLAIH